MAPFNFTLNDELAANTLRFLSTDMVQKANSGHPGLPLGAAPMAYVLWSRFLKFNPKAPSWPNRDRFILSAGHGSALLYSLLHVYGYDLPMSELKNFRQLGSKTAGHPESTLVPGIEVTTGPLGQGFANGVGEAIAEAFLAEKYSQQIINHYTYAIVSDGDLMEGIASEAASLAGHLKLGKLIYLYDDNLISLDGPTSLAFTENVPTRFEAYGWHTITVKDGNNLEEIAQAILSAQQETQKPTLISVKTIIGFGSPQQGTHKVHGSPLGEENLKKTKEHFGWDPNQTFYIPAEAQQLFDTHIAKGKEQQKEWQSEFDSYSKENPELAKQFQISFEGKLPENWDADFPKFKVDEPMATRDASGKTLDAIKKSVPWVIGGSADLASSNSTPGKGEDSFQPQHYGNTNIWFGVREHAMGGILNGIAAHGGTKAYGATFLTFSDYMRGSIRLAALTEASVTYIFTHDSIALGEDGPTHQPVEQVTSLRAIPNLTVIRPADANETAEAWRIAINREKGPVALILTRQKLPIINQEKFAPASNVAKGGYILSDSDKTPEIILIATGSEVQLILGAQEKLQKDGIAARVVSLPSFELFEKQSQSYRDTVLPPSNHKRLAVEAGITQAWYKYVTAEGDVIGIDSFGESGPGDEVLKHFGFTIENVYNRAKILLNK